jgi:hypothetical protein
VYWIFYAALLCGITGKKPDHKGKKIGPFYQGLESKKQCHIRAWMCFQEKKVLGYPQP